MRVKEVTGRGNFIGDIFVAFNQLKLNHFNA
jgi:hypothetical protein